MSQLLIREYRRNEKDVLYKRFCIVKKHFIGESVLHRYVYGLAGESPVLMSAFAETCVDASNLVKMRHNIANTINNHPTYKFKYQLRDKRAKYIVNEMTPEDFRIRYSAHFI